NYPDSMKESDGEDEPHSSFLPEMLNDYCEADEMKEEPLEFKDEPTDDFANVKLEEADINICDYPANMAGCSDDDKNSGE
ncbi:hypothetical protein PMAYCL1PPCAC_01665, partial [Pristionchus mayeri]